MGPLGAPAILLNNTHYACEDATQADMTFTCRVISSPMHDIFQVACQGAWGSFQKSRRPPVIRCTLPIALGGLSVGISAMTDSA